MDELLKNCLKPTDQMIKNLIEIELNFINLQRPEMGDPMSLIASATSSQQNSPNEKPKSSKSDGKKEESSIVDKYDQKLENLLLLKKESQEQSVRKNSLDHSFIVNDNNKFGKVKLAQPPALITVPERMSEKEKVEVKLLKGVLTTYFDLVKKSIADMVPKTIITFLVKKVKNCNMN